MKKMTLCYVHVPGDPAHDEQCRQFLESYHKHPPGIDHDTILISQINPATSGTRDAFAALPGFSEFMHDDTGWDIGAYIALAKSGKVGSEAMLCCGGSTTFRRAGWMARMVEAWDKHGAGFYGSLSSYQCRPHFNTNGFWTAPFMLDSYPEKVDTKEQRYEFEHGKGALWWRLNQLGFPTKLVTWDGEYDWMDWRKPANISCRGDQSNCLTHFRINYQFEEYAKSNPQAHHDLMYLTDVHILDDDFKVALKYLTEPYG